MLTTTQSKYQYSPNGATTVFAFPVYYTDSSHVVVILTTGGIDATKVLGVDYTLSVAGPALTGGNVVFGAAPAAGTTLTIKRVVPLTQLSSYVSNDSFPSPTLERNLDLLTMIAQQLQDSINNPPIVATITALNQTVTATTGIYTPAATGQYLLCITVTTKVVGAAGSFGIYVNYTTPGGGTNVDTITLINTAVPQLTEFTSVMPIAAVAGVPINLVSHVTGGAGFTYDLRASLIKLQ